LPTADGDVWLKAVPPFFAHEGAAIHTLAAPTLPPLIAFDDLGRTLLEDVRGVDQYQTPSWRQTVMIDALVELQAGAVDRVDDLLAAGAPDWRAGPFAVAAADVVERGGVGLEVEQRRILDRLVAGLDARFRALAESGIPDTFVHGDFHTGNVRWTDAGPVIFDWGDCGIGNPLMDLPPFDRNLSEEQRPAARARWIEQWTIRAPGSDAARAVGLIRPIATLRLAVIYQAFLDGIEQTERMYHEADVPEQLREAARLAIEET
jgi:aminoglycoside phosphotransferase (APT) family kinase protein